MERNTDLSLPHMHVHSYMRETNVGANQLLLVNALAELSNSGITIYDMNRGVHVYTSSSFYKVFGFEGINEGDVSNSVFDSRVHPADLRILAKNGALAMKYVMERPVPFRKDYKMITEYRIKNNGGNYIQVTESHHVLELDQCGNIALSLGIINVSPNQSLGQGVRFQLINCHTGQLIDLLPKAEPAIKELTLREHEILEMIRKGKLSKEISALLSISVHTVNTHRQRILEKLNAGNAMEAIIRALDRGIIS
ncbi:helix-turn-helix transcriptional regulator [Dyadobacter luteus]|jgi:DNA-binding CsgD family transcriptional regulator|uniref:Helix-turn-helix transcriptional regulator n=1 Tax=Dyadobacter luteus TaxID=2259619 RepID=A0A3D8Y8Y3_9BACT|nr:helix-turn-helix transcriptional regulator [Dyadobacter luteus]REA59720.1 helix-turn-helix transcriptional regulator [Dyadobacter luteus]